MNGENERPSYYNGEGLHHLNKIKSNRETVKVVKPKDCNGGIPYPYFPYWDDINNSKKS